MPKKLILLALLSLLLSACATPMNTTEFRQAAKANSSLLTSESFEVNRPVSEVANRFREKSAECLDFRLGTAQRNMFGGTSSPRYYAQSRQTVRVSSKGAELTFQVKY